MFQPFEMGDEVAVSLRLLRKKSWHWRRSSPGFSEGPGYLKSSFLCQAQNRILIYLYIYIYPIYPYIYIICMLLVHAVCKCVYIYAQVCLNSSASRSSILHRPSAILVCLFWYCWGPRPRGGPSESQVWTNIHILGKRWFQRLMFFSNYKFAEAYETILSMYNL